MQIVLDAHIPFAADIFSEIGLVRAIPGQEIAPEHVKNADILIVRSVTQVGKKLLEGSTIRFVGSATAGMDHLDTEYLSASGIEYANAPGANAFSVVEYVLGSLAVVSARNGENLLGKTLGIVGCGHVGRLLAQTCRALGMSVLINDPPRQEKGLDTGLIALSELLDKCDIVSVHTPLTRKGPHRTLNLLDWEELSAMRRGSWLVQTSRGGVVHEFALRSALKSGQLGAAIIDVWQNEPEPDQDLVLAADIATGHIAGYSVDAKRQGVQMIRDAVCQALDLRHPSFGASRAEEPSAEGAPTNATSDGLFLGNRRVESPDYDKSDPRLLDAIMSQMIDIRTDDERFRAIFSAGGSTGHSFHEYRASYPNRRSFSKHVIGTKTEYAGLLKKLGLTSTT